MEPLGQDSSYELIQRVCDVLLEILLRLCFTAQRSDIVRAAYEPTDEECEWKADEEEELTVSKQVQMTDFYC